MLSKEEISKIQTDVVTGKVDLDVPAEVVDEGFGPLKCPTCNRDVPANYVVRCNECTQKLKLY